MACERRGRSQRAGARPNPGRSPGPAEAAAAAGHTPGHWHAELRPVRRPVSARAGPAGTSSRQYRRTGRRGPGGLQERPAACSLVGPFMIVAAAPGSAGPTAMLAGLTDPAIGGACQLRAWGKGQGAWAAWAVRSAEARSLAGRVSLGLGQSPDSQHEIRPQWQSPHWSHSAITPAGSGASDARSCHFAHRHRD